MSPKFWEYFLSIEADLSACSRYVEFCEENYDCHSIEFGRIIVSACAEIDAILKELSLFLEPGKPAQNINNYHASLSSILPMIKNAKLDVRRYKLNLNPWSDWNGEQSPEWWGNAYNKIKHNRTENYRQANLFNALRSAGGLFIVIMAYHQCTTGESVHVDFNRGTVLFTPAKTVGDKSGVYWFYGIE